MDFNDFKICMRYILNEYYNNDLTPNTSTVNAVRTFNMLRATNAKKIASKIKNQTLLNDLRHSEKIVQLNKTVPNSVCIISNEKLQYDTGKIIIVHLDESEKPYSIHRRFLIILNNFFCIMHFDKEIIKSYNVFMNSIQQIPSKEKIEYFLKYNNSSNVNLLLIKFNNMCEN